MTPLSGVGVCPLTAAINTMIFCRQLSVVDNAVATPHTRARALHRLHMYAGVIIDGKNMTTRASFHSQHTVTGAITEAARREAAAVKISIAGRTQSGPGACAAATCSSRSSSIPAAALHDGKKNGDCLKIEKPKQNTSCYCCRGASPGAAFVVVAGGDAAACRR